METTVNSSMCRCCASEGLFKDVNSTYHWMGEDEVYADMLRFCFDITLASAEGLNNGGICEVCITQLRNAANFKKQVQHTEEQFKKRLAEVNSYKPEVIKVEMSLEDGAESDNNLSEDYQSGTEFEVPIKEESPEPKPKKRAAKATTSKAKKAKTDSGETSTKRPRSPGIRTKPKIAYIEISAEPLTSLDQKGADLKREQSPEIQILLRKKNELDLHLDNLRVILMNSNATTIRCRGSIGYVCCFCDEQYPDPADLKQHTLDTHDDVFESSFMKSQAMPTLLIKLDITNLYCKICSKEVWELEDLLEHLKDDHGIPHHSNINSHIVPFRFDSQTLRCVVCKHIFNNFKVLLEHMNMHFRNYVCDVCDAGFVNKRISQMHGYRHKTGIYHCSYCGKEFNNRVKQRAHERAVHVCLNKRSKCGYCGERFSDYTKKQEHEVKEHGAKPLVLTCYACEKTFDNQRTLSLHIKTFHLMER